VFTGLIEATGEIVRTVSGQGGGRTLTIRAPFVKDGIAIGDSIATSGVCLTATKISGDTFDIDAGPETLARTTIGELQAGDLVNLERSATLATRLGGHLVQGHVDAVGTIAAVKKHENAWDLDVAAPDEVLRLAIPRGSITVDGISLTITGRSATSFSLSIIPHTYAVTTIKNVVVGSRVNLEVDLIARYVAGLLGFAQSPRPGITEAFLKEHGFG
jgi:riboflavin synthase